MNDKIRVETWHSDKGAEEIHHFIEDTEIYLFGFNRKLFGETLYHKIFLMVAQALDDKLGAG